MPDLNGMRQRKPSEDEGEHHRGYLRDNDYSMTTVSIGETAADRREKKDGNL
jgi:hypothetical protein